MAGVCLGDGIICVPTHSKFGKQICLSGSILCNGEDDCLNAADEKDCPALLNGGIQALIVLVVIGVVVLIPVVFIIVRRKQGKTVIPSAIRPVLERISPCFAENKGDRSSQHLHEINAGQSPDSNDGITNRGYEAATANNYSTQHAVTGRPLNKFRVAVADNEQERASSYRDWQANRLQQSKQSSKTNSPKITNGHPTHNNNSQRNGGMQDMSNLPHQLYSGVHPEHTATVHQAPITYAASSNRATENGNERRAPYAIASSDGRSNYETRSHLRSHGVGNSNEPSHPTAGQWQRHVDPNRNKYQIDSHSSQGPPPDYAAYAAISSAVPPQQLRQALERVADSTPYSHYQQPYAHHYDHTADHTADTVV